MKKLALLLVLFMSGSDAVFSQDFRPGYIVTNDTDTTRGLVAYEEGAQVYQSCNFKASENGATTVYSPTDIKGYGFENDKIFESREVSVTDEPATKTFVEVIVRGAVSLFKAGRIFWINKNGDDLQKLVNTAESGMVRGTAVIKYGNEHIHVLTALMSDCPGLQRRIEKIQLAERPLTILVSDYNQCRGEPVLIYKSSKPWTKVVAGITLGVNLSMLSFESDVPDHYLTGKFEVSATPAVGLSADVSFPRFSERLAFHAELTYLSTKYNSYKADFYTLVSVRNYTSIAIDQLKLPLGFRYQFPIGNLMPYVSAGISQTLHLSKGSVWTKEVESKYIVQTFQDEAIAINDSQHGIWGGLGVTKAFDRFDAAIGVTYEETRGIVGSVFDINKSTTSKVGNIQVSIAIKTK